MSTYFIIDEETKNTTDWSPAPYLNVGPMLILAGEYKDRYAVNVKIFDSDPLYESYRSLLESMPTANCSDPTAWWPEPEE